MNLLSYSKPREPTLEPVNPRKLIEECLELIAPNAADRGVMVVSDIDKDHPAIPMDAAGMHQVVMNLLSNALDAVARRRLDSGRMPLRRSAEAVGDRGGRQRRGHSAEHDEAHVRAVP